MKKLFGLAVLGVTCLVGCATDTSVAGHSSDMGTPPNAVARNPNLSSGEGGLLIEGTVISDTKDALLIEDDEGFQRALRVDEQTLFRQEGGDLVARKFLEPGSQVRTSWDYNNQERIAREVIIVHDVGRKQPNAWPEDPSPYRRNP
ncbi:MAG TPA: hypothetical protein VF815_37730 [Myxococcaceae bacterium]|jgi:hypothetical protein